MKFHLKQNGRRIALAGTMTAAAVMLALAPMNMGGCSAGSLGDAVGSAVGGTTGQLISAGGKAAQAEALGEEQEPAMGQSVAVAITSRYGLDPDVSLNRYVTLVGWTVANSSPRAEMRFNFGVLNSDEVNAYAGPAGYILVTRGAIMRMQDESELAGVLAHEIAHVCEKHGLNMMKASLRKEAALQAINTNDKVAQFNVATDTLAKALVEGQYSRDQESRADLLAVDYVTAAGYDPNGYHRYLQRMAAAQSSNAKVMSSHPGMADRANRVAAKIKEKGSPGGATVADRFKKNVARPTA